MPARSVRLAALGLFASKALGGGGEQKFEAFTAAFEKTYDGERESSARAAAFRDNLAFIEAENAKGHSYEVGINQFADMTQEEYALHYLGFHASQRAWGKLPFLGTHEISKRALEDSVDWSSKGAVTPAKNQQQCGSCWAFSTTGALEGAWQIATGKLVSISEQQLVDCSSKFGELGCKGGGMDNAFQYAEENAMCTEESYPYKAAAGICLLPSCTVGIPKGGVVGFKDVQSGSLQALMDAVSQQPVSIAIEADQRSFQLYKSGVLDADCGDKLDHGVLLVGYGVDAGKKYWKIKNSWGPLWGEGGYIRLTREKSGTGECGLLSQPSYPVVSGPSPGPSEVSAVIAAEPDITV